VHILLIYKQLETKQGAESKLVKIIKAIIADDEEEFQHKDSVMSI
jgi:hypothetical protein